MSTPRIFIKSAQYVTMPVQVGPTVDSNGIHCSGHTQLQRVRIKTPEVEIKGMSRYAEAIAMASQAHAGQVRKGTENASGLAVPYITHPVAVSALVVKYGGGEEQAIAALLHDALEDGGPQWRAPIREKFGERVLKLVEACTDGEPDASGHKAPWKERKESYLASFTKKPDEALLVAGCDKLHNLQSINADRAEIGDAVFDRFTATKEQTLWYYSQLVQTLVPRVPEPLGSALMLSLSTLMGPQQT